MAFKNNKNTEDFINEARGESEKETKEKKPYKHPRDYGIISLYLTKEEKEKIKSIAQKKKMLQRARSSSSRSFMREA